VALRCIENCWRESKRDSSTAWPRGHKTAEGIRGHFAQNDT